MSEEVSRITLTGNCQTRCLSWYIQQLNFDFDVKWIQPEFSSEMPWANGDKFQNKPVHTITEIEDSIRRLCCSDVVIYQHMKGRTSENFNTEKIKSYNAECRYISISDFTYLPGDPLEESLKSTIHRSETLNIDVPAHKIIEKHGEKIKISKNNKRHPTVFYFLELVREICLLTNWDYYNEKQYSRYLSEAYPSDY